MICDSSSPSDVALPPASESGFALHYPLTYYESCKDSQELSLRPQAFQMGFNGGIFRAGDLMSVATDLLGALEEGFGQFGTGGGRWSPIASSGSGGG